MRKVPITLKHRSAPSVASPQCRGECREARNSGVGRNGSWEGREGERGVDVCACTAHTARRETTEVPYSAVRKPQHGRNEQ